MDSDVPAALGSGADASLTAVPAGAAVFEDFADGEPSEPAVVLPSRFTILDSLGFASWLLVPASLSFLPSFVLAGAEFVPLFATSVAPMLGMLAVTGGRAPLPDRNCV
jgi:hypothetical protein